MLVLGGLLVPSLVALLVFVGLERPAERRTVGPVAPTTGAAASSPNASDGSFEQQAPPQRTVTGTITGPDDELVADALVAVAAHAGLGVRSGGDGRYRLTGLPLGELALTVTARGYQRARVELGVGSPGGHRRRDVRLERGPAVTGVVVDSDGRPVEGATVRCRGGDVAPSAEPSAEPSALSDGAGRFELGPEAAGCVAVAQHPVHGQSEPETLGSGGRNRLYLPGAASIEGVVVDERGRAVTRYLLAVDSYRPRGHGTDKPSAGRRIQVDDPQGAFVLDGLRPGEYVLVATADGRPPAHSASIELEAGGREQRVRIVLGRGGALSGRVVDELTGEPISDARVALDTATTTRLGSTAAAQSDGAGRYRLEGTPAGPFSVRVWARGYRSRVRSGLSTESGAELEIDIALAPLGEGDGRGTEFSGIGAMVGPGPEGVAIVGLIDGGPAEQAGLRKGDVVLRIDGVDVRGWSTAQCVQKLRGRAGSRVSITLRRGQGPPIERTVTRSSFVR